MSHITLKARYKSLEVKEEREFPNIIDKVKELGRKTFHAVNEYFGLDEGTKFDLAIFYGFYALCGFIGLILIGLNIAF